MPKTFPSLVFYNLGAGVARPGELSSPRRANLPPFFFFEGNINHVPSSLTSQHLPNLNPLKLELGVDYLFKTNK